VGQLLTGIMGLGNGNGIWEARGVSCEWKEGPSRGRWIENLLFRR
jgi:hypothetical protein